MDTTKEQSNFNKTDSMGGRKKPIYPGDTVICVHDSPKDENIKSGDTLKVTGICPGCGGLILEGSDHHHKRDDFDLFQKTTPVKIDRRKLYKAIDDVNSKVLYNSANGVIPVDTFKMIFTQFLSDIEVKEDYFKSLY